MAEDYGVSLKITADTSDLDKIPQKVEATRKEIEKPVEQTVVEKREQGTGNRERTETVKIKEEREPAAPVEHPAETVPVTERRETAAPVEHPAETVAVTERRETAAPVEHQPETVPVVEQREAAAPVEHPDETVAVTEQREPAAPVEHPAETVPVQERRETAAPVEHQPETVKVKQDPDPLKPNVEKPAPVKIEAKADKVRVEVEDAEAKKRIEALTKDEGVKRIRVVTEGGELSSRQGGKEIFELEVDAERAKQTIADLKADARLKVTADTSAAEASLNGFFGRIRRGVTAVRSTLSTVFAGFGMVSFVVMGVMSLVAGFQKLRDMATATSRAIQQMRFDAWLGGFNAAADAMIGKHQKIIALLREEQDVANKAASLATMKLSQDRAQEDSARNQVRSVQLASATDPREKARLEQQFASEDAEISRRRFNEDKKRKLAQLDEEQSIYQSKANGAASQIGNVDREIENQEDIVFKARKTIENGGEKEKYDKVIEAAKKRIESLKDEKKALEDLQKTAQREADYRGKQIEIVSKSQPSQSSSASQQLAAAQNAAFDKQDRREQRNYTEQRDRRAADADWDARFRAAQRRASAPDATEQQRNEAENTQLEMLRGREQEASAELEAAEKELAEEMAKEAKDRDEDRMSRARERAARAQGEQISAAQQREDIAAQIENRRVSSAQDYFGNLAAQIDASRPKDRLTAMGLGSGGPSDSTGREQISIQREIAKSLREAISAIRANKPGDGTAVYAP